MQIGLVGLGKMGGGMALRLAKAGHDVVGFDISADTRARAVEAGARVVEEITALPAALTGPRVVWVMLPPGELTQGAVEQLAALLDEGDLVVDGGNSDFRDAPGRAGLLAERGIRYADVGVSGGQWGRENGYGLMVGADEASFAELEPALSALSADDGYSRVGGVGAGHLVKAIHNGIQYGLLQAYAEGFALLEGHPEVDSLAAMEAWQQGSSIRSFLLEQTIEALRANPTLADVDSRVSDSGMGRWTAEEAIRLGIATPALTAGLQARFASRSDGAPNRLLVAARGRIGGQKK
jgi:6-phosphogluconate dehydrogenase